MSDSRFTTAISEHIWRAKYRFRAGDGRAEAGVQETWDRIARAIAAAEPAQAAGRAAEYRRLLEAFRLLPGGRIIAGAGTGRRLTLFNCFVMGLIEDTTEGIFDALREGALTMQQGGGVGYDFSTLRPAGAPASASGARAAGPVAFMDVWNAACATLLAGGNRRGAMMATLRCDHPDVEAFVGVKADPARLRHFNLSVQVDDAFMKAVERDQSWPLVFPAAGLLAGEGETLSRQWTGAAEPVDCRLAREVPARHLWRAILQGAYDYAEPGVLFVDTINRENNLHYRERLTATNPCGEIPLPPYGACNLGSLNLTQFVRSPFTGAADIDHEALADAARQATRFLDDVVTVSDYPLEAQAEQARATRRLGLGITGLADALVMIGLRYDSDAARDTAARIMCTVCHSAYRASVALAGERGSFPAFDRDAYLGGAFIRRLPPDIQDGIARHGIRNSHLTAIAPAGTISLLANNCSSGIEPIFAGSYERNVLEPDGSHRRHDVTDYAWQAYGGAAPAFVCAHELSPDAHLAMMAAVQPWVDNAISKTVNVPADFDFEAFQGLYERAYALGLKGCTAFRANEVTGSVLEAGGGAHCCNVEAEPD